MKRYFYGLTWLMRFKRAALPGVALLLGAALLAAAPLLARAESVPDLIIKGGQIEIRNPKSAGGGLLDLNDYVGDAICYSGDAAFILPCPGGWTGDPAAAGRLDLCGIYYPQGYTFDNAPVVMYPRLVTPLSRQIAGRTRPKTGRIYQRQLPQAARRAKPGRAQRRNLYGR